MLLHCVCMCIHTCVHAHAHSTHMHTHAHTLYDSPHIIRILSYYQSIHMICIADTYILMLVYVHWWIDLKHDKFEVCSNQRGCVNDHYIKIVYVTRSYLLGTSKLLRKSIKNLYIFFKLSFFAHLDKARQKLLFPRMVTSD